MVDVNEGDSRRPFGAQTGFLADLSHAAEAKDCSLFVFDPGEQRSAERLRGYTRRSDEWRLSTVHRPGALYDRWLPQSRRSGSGAAPLDEFHLAYRTFNPLPTSVFMRDKVWTHSELLLQGVPVPPSTVVGGAADLRQCLDKGATYVLKPRYGEQSEGLHWLTVASSSHVYLDGSSTTIDDVARRFRDHQCQRDLRSAGKDLGELRVLVQNVGGSREVAGMYARNNAWSLVDGQWVRTRWVSAVEDVALRTGQDVGTVRAGAARVAISAVRAADRCTASDTFECGVDIIVTEDGAMSVIELNSMPARFGLKILATYADTEALRMRYRYERETSVLQILDYFLSLGTQDTRRD